MLTAEPRLISEQMGFSSGARPLPPGARHPWRRERFDFSCGQFLPFFPALESTRVHKPPSLPPPPHRSARHGRVRPARSPAAWLGLRPRDEGVGTWRGAARRLRHARPRTSLATAAPSHTRGRHRRPRAQTARPAVSLPSVGRGGTSCHSRRVSIKYKENTSA